LSRPLLKLVPVKTGIGGGLLIDYSTKKLKSQEIFEKNFCDSDSRGLYCPRFLAQTTGLTKNPIGMTNLRGKIKKK